MTDAPSMPVRRDRYAGLVIFGILQLLIGVICILMTLGVAAASGRMPQTSMPRGAALAQAMVVYALAAVYFVSAGIGSIHARRWARALTIVVSAMWGITGVISTIMMGVLMPRLRGVVPPGSPATTIFGCAIGVFVIGGILIPAALFFFYRTDAVRETCERRDPVSRWTDRAPLPVLAVSIVLAFTAITLLVSLSNPVLPLLGSVLTGAPAALTLLSLSFLCAFLSVQVYRLKESAWWTLVLLQVIGCVIGALTFVRMDTERVSDAAGTPDLSSMYREPLFVAMMIATWVGYFAFLLYLKRYFGRIVPRTRREDY